MTKEELKAEIMSLVRIACSYAWDCGCSNAEGNAEREGRSLTEELRIHKLIEKKLEELEELD